MMKRAVLTLLIVALLGAGAFGLGQFREAQRMRVELAAVSKDLDDLRGKLRGVERARPTSVISAEAAVTPTGEELTGPETWVGAAPAVAVPANRRQTEPGRINALMNSPEMQQLMVLQQKGGLDARYAALFRRLNLSPADLDTLKHLLVEKQAVVADVMAAARSQGMGGRENRDDLRVLVEATRAETDESIRAAIGDAAYAQYKNYEATLPQRGLVDQLSQRLSYSSTPLADTQVEQMVQILAATSPANQAGGRNAATSTGTAFPRINMAASGGGVRVTDETVAQARGVLTAQQLEALQSLQQEQQAAASLREQMRLNRQNQQSGGAVPANRGGG